MATQQSVLLKCPQCGADWEAQKPKILNAALDKKDIARLMDGSLFRQNCPKCGHSFIARHSLSLNDIEKGYYLIFDAGGFDTQSQIKEAQELYPGVKVRVDDDVMDLLEKVHVFEANLNDRIIVYLDYRIKEDISKKLKQQKSPIVINKILFDHLDLKSKKITFGALSNAQKPIFIDTPYSDYLGLANTTKPNLAKAFNENSGDYVVNTAWAAAL